MTIKDCHRIICEILILFSEYILLIPQVNILLEQAGTCSLARPARKQRGACQGRKSTAEKLAQEAIAQKDLRRPAPLPHLSGRRRARSGDRCAGRRRMRERKLHCVGSRRSSGSADRVPSIGVAATSPRSSPGTDTRHTARRSSNDDFFEETCRFYTAESKTVLHGRCLRCRTRRKQAILHRNWLT